MIATRYLLPFRFEYVDVGRLRGRPVSIAVKAAVPDEGGVVAEALRAFTRLAKTGALGSRDIPPWETEFIATFEPATRPQEALVRVESCCLAPEAWVVLAHLLLRAHRFVPIESVDVRGDEYFSPVPLRYGVDSTYPRVLQPLPFVLEDTKPEGGGYSFFIILESPLVPAHEAVLNRHLSAWVGGVCAGAYALAPIDPVNDYVEPDSAGITAYDTTIEWAVFKLRADPVAALGGLLNLLAWFHVCGQPIRSVEIA